MFSLKNHLPKSLFGRALAIIIIPIAIMQIVVAYIFFEAHWQTVTSRLSDSVAADIAVTTRLYDQDPGAARAQTLNALITPQMQISLKLAPDEALPTKTRNAFFSNLDRTLRRALSDALGDRPFWFDTTRYPNHIDIRVQSESGTLRYIAPRERVFASTGFIFIFWMAMATAFLSFVSILFILNQARPIVRLADAAEAFGKGENIDGFKPSGASEVRQAGQAFINMKDRIGRHIEQRTTLLAGVSHDLRTPLTRLKLQLAMADDTDDILAARRDITDMETMLNGYLDFARGLEGEDMAQLNINALIADVIAPMGAPKPQFTQGVQVKVTGRDLAIRRALTNIIENARAYAESVFIHVAAKDGADHIDIIIDDDGPGIPTEKRSDAFKPFVRLDAARSQNINGVGLGLSIARDAANVHGGDLILGDSPKGGLRVTFRLPT